MKKIIILLLLVIAGATVKAQSSGYDFSVGNYYYKVTNK